MICKILKCYLSICKSWPCLRTFREYIITTITWQYVFPYLSVVLWQHRFVIFIHKLFIQVNCLLGDLYNKYLSISWFTQLYNIYLCLCEGCLCVWLHFLQRMYHVCWLNRFNLYYSSIYFGLSPTFSVINIFLCRKHKKKLKNIEFFFKCLKNFTFLKISVHFVLSLTISKIS